MRYFKKYTDLNMQKMCSPLNLKLLKHTFAVVTTVSDYCQKYSHRG